MRIVIDAQGIQSVSRTHGIGRLGIELTRGIARYGTDHEVWLVLNSSLGHAPDIERDLAGLIDSGRIRSFAVPGPTAEYNTAHNWRKRTAELIREHVIHSLRPDCVLVLSLFEGLSDDAATSVGGYLDGVSTAVVLHDLIPLLNPAEYLGSKLLREQYERKIRSLRRAGLLLANSEHTRHEAISALGRSPEQVVTIGAAADGRFCPGPIDNAVLLRLSSQFGIERRPVLYTPSGFDSRKNIRRLIEAYAGLPADVRARHQLILTSATTPAVRRHLRISARRAGLKRDEMVLTGHVSDADLISLYRAAAVFVYPSEHEGFGLPALEAMACGAPVIGSNTTSIPEVIGLSEALFDPRSVPDITAAMMRVVTDAAFADRLRRHGVEQAGRFSWQSTARAAITALEHHSKMRSRAVPGSTERHRIAFVSPLVPLETGAESLREHLLRSLLANYAVDMIVDEDSEPVASTRTAALLRRRTHNWFRLNSAAYSRVIFEISASPRNGYVERLATEHAGIALLVDSDGGERLPDDRPTVTLAGPPDDLVEAVEAAFRTADFSEVRLLRSIAAIPGLPRERRALSAVANAIAESLPEPATGCAEPR